ncbi:MAG: succinate dehydrogenase assembly factor 2 [Gammaproteobacteria bacterium]|nr:succinate dehydrogenase assembly factor 2 [Gammaproteobacteria bacterium]MBV8308455.1 succinate dehydrogenase assembly factor 2 [Gammaproteobacteria bacterium]MBV8405201.1 succinate dehydrogenase assembly factor 2 [Gammaproteobacteria bacterium]
MTHRGLPAGAQGAEREEEAAGRLRWRCRRGFRELDVLLERFAQRALPAASLAECRVYAELLELPDPLLLGYLLGDDTPAEPRLARALGTMRALCRLDDRPAVFCR